MARYVSGIDSLISLSAAKANKCILLKAVDREIEKSILQFSLQRCSVPIARAVVDWLLGVPGQIQMGHRISQKIKVTLSVCHTGWS